MQRHVTPDPELGKLAIHSSGGSGSSKAPSRDIGSRTLAKRGKHNAPSRPSQAAAATTGSPSALTGSDVNDSNDDDDESSSAESADDANDSTSSRLSATSTRYKNVMAIMSCFEPSQLSLHELMGHNVQSLSQASQHYRSLVHAIAGLVRSDQDLAQLSQAVPISGEFWSTQTVNNFSDRVLRSIASFRQDPTSNDSMTTLERIRDVFDAAEFTLERGPKLPAEARLQLLTILVGALREIVATDEVRPSQPLVYAGGSQHHEFNLSLRFTMFPEAWKPCIDVIYRLMALESMSGAFHHPIVTAALSETFKRMRQRDPNTWNDSMRDFTTRLGMINRSLGLQAD